MVPIQNGVERQEIGALRLQYRKAKALKPRGEPVGDTGGQQELPVLLGQFGNSVLDVCD